MMRVDGELLVLAELGGQCQPVRIGHAGVEEHQRVGSARADSVPEGVQGGQAVAHRRRLHLPAA